MSNDIVGRLRGQVSDEAIKVVIPQLAIGEAIDNFWQDYWELGEAEAGTIHEMMDELGDLMRQLDARTCRVSTDAFKTAAELHSLDTRLSGNDACIAACALEDPWSEKLLSFDGHFIDTDAIETVNNDRQPNPRWNNLTVSSEF